MKKIYGLIAIALFPLFFLVPSFLAHYQTGEYEGSEVSSFLDSYNPFAAMKPAAGTAPKYVISSERFDKLEFGLDNSVSRRRYVLDYHLNTPKKPWPNDLKFPLVVHLHDKNTPAYSSEYLTQTKVAFHFPAFNVVPVLEPYFNVNDTSFGFSQASNLPGPTSLGKVASRFNTAHPSSKTKKGSIKDKDALKLYHKNSMENSQSAVPDIIALTKEIIKRYPIDENRIYVVGCGYGGLAMLGAIRADPKLFDAGMVISASWSNTDTMPFVKTPLYIANGSGNTFFPAVSSRIFAKTLHQNQGRVAYKEFEAMPHDCSYVGFYKSHVWKWLFAQRL